MGSRNTIVLFIGSERLAASLGPRADALDVQLHVVPVDDVTTAASRYTSIVDGAVWAEASREGLAVLQSLLPRLPISVVDPHGKWSPEGVGELEFDPETLVARAFESVIESVRVLRSPAKTASETEGPEGYPGGGCFTASEGFRLSGLSRTRSALEAATLLDASLRWHQSLAESLGQSAPWITLRWRYASVGATLLVGLIVSAEGGSPDEARRRLRAALYDLSPLLRAGATAGGAYVFDVAQTEAFFVPLRPRSAASLGPPVVEDFMPLFEMPAGALPLWSAGLKSVEVESADKLALAFGTREPFEVVSFLRTIHASPVPVLVDVVLRASPLSSEDRRRAQEISRRAALMSESALFSGPGRLASRALGLALHGGHALEFALVLAAESDAIPRAVTTAAARTFFGDTSLSRLESARGAVRDNLLVIDSIPAIEPLASRITPAELGLLLPTPGFPIFGIRSLHPSRLTVPTTLPNEGALWGHAPDGREVRIPAEGFTHHVLLSGATGTGKSTVLAHTALELAESGHGVLVLDPHGPLCAHIKKQLPRNRRRRVIELDAESDAPLTLNLLDYDRDAPETVDRCYNDLIGFMRSRYPAEFMGPVWETHIRKALALLAGDPEEQHALPDLVRLFTDEMYRKELVDRCESDEVKMFWELVEKRSGDATLANLGPYVFSKLSSLVDPIAVRRILGSTETTFDVPGYVRRGAVVLCTLQARSLGPEGTSLVGSAIMSRVIRAAFDRLGTDRDGEQQPFVVIADEAHRFATSGEVPMLLAEGRKTSVGLVLATQSLRSLGHEVRDAALSNAAVVAAMRVSMSDAVLLAPALAPSFDAEDLVTLSRGEVAMRMQLPNGDLTQPFLVKTRPEAD